MINLHAAEKMAFDYLYNRPACAAFILQHCREKSEQCAAVMYYLCKSGEQYAQDFLKDLSK